VHDDRLPRADASVDGERFEDDTVGYSAFASHIIEQDGGVAFKQFDSRIYDLVERHFDDFHEAARFYKRADTVEELAAELGCDPDATSQSVAQYNEAAERGGPDEVGRTEALNPLSAPFYGVEIEPALFHTQGGLVVDADGRVQRPDGSTIDDLYAGGGTAVGISGHGNDGYSGGNGLTTALGFGRLAGVHARESLTGSN
jgi:fumarate reductase flavoprotein subunit